MTLQLPAELSYFPGSDNQKIMNALEPLKTYLLWAVYMGHINVRVLALKESLLKLVLSLLKEKRTNKRNEHNLADVIGLL